MENGTKRSAKAKGGLARAKNLSPEKRSEIATIAAKARWAVPRPENVNHPRVLESFRSELDLAGIKIPCAIVEGPNGIQRVLTENGITLAILGSRSGASKRLKKTLEEEGAPTPLFIAPRQLLPFIDEELKQGPLKPIDYLDGDRLVRGYEASILPAICNVWLRAREAGALQTQQLAKAQKAEILTRALAETGIVALVDEATGYQSVRPQNALQEYLKLLIREQLAVWVKKFPDEFFENIYKIKGWQWPGMKKNRYSVVGKYIRDLVYERLAPGVLKELEQKSPKDEKGQRPNKLHQWLTDDIGDPMLANHLHTLIMFQRVALANGYGWNRFLHMVDQAMTKKGQNLELPLTNSLDSNES
ncbi:MAG: P63C domain-containing protein [Deltaproteobacteria bacterium]|nr:P63C domain-containing protein [Deltaproteobacteria bacterium]